ncbi:MAG: type I DNA topoisomerase [Anaerolineae bacterium]
MSDNVMQAYCVKCKEKREIAKPQPTYTRTGTPATKGECPVCGTGLFRMGETEAHADIPKPEVVASPKKKKTKTKKKSKKSNRRKRNIGKLVIVESPAKARSIGGYLGKGYTVMASKGHVRDLLVTQLSVDVENDFEPKYRVPNDKRTVVKEIKAAAQDADEIYLATDPDREGEAIAWHLVAATDVDDKDVKRVVFHEITKDAVKEAFDHPREIDMSLVNAQQARRILDRLVGYNITELLWDKVRNRLSAGRVQSIALRVVVDREREIEAFNPVEYWSIEAELSKQPSGKKKAEMFTAKLAKIHGEDFELNSEDEVRPHLKILEKSDYIISEIKRGTRTRKPSPPFTTSTLQQEASRRLGFNARRTMRAAQQLYEGIELGNGETSGLITYMRTDSLNVSPQSQNEARSYIGKTYGDDYMPKKPIQYKTSSKGAQEAHEAIRPTNVFRTPDSLKSRLSRDQYKLYELIWLRFVASQMSKAVYNTIRVEINAGINRDDMPYLFRSSGSRIKFQGFLALYEDSKDEDDTSENDEGRIFPEMDEGELLRLLQLLPQQHFTQPPPRYTEASLVRALEENGIGRPSTYAPTVAVIQDRDYVNKENKRLVPTETGKVVSNLLVEYFKDEMQYEFTAKMEDQLDEIAESNSEWRPVLHNFYAPFETRLKNARKNMPVMKQEEKVGRICPTCNDGDLVIKYGRYGKFIGCSNYPECRHTEQYIEYTGITCPTCGEEHGGELTVKKTRKGRTFYGCSRYPDCEYSTWKLPKSSQNNEDGNTEEDTEEELPLTS